MLVGSGKAPSKNSRLLHGDEVNRDSYLSAKPSTGNELAYATAARGVSGEAVRIFVARDSRKVPGIVDSLDREWWRAWRRSRGAPELRITRYYPYYFQSWKITAPKTFGRTVRVILYTGVNGMNRSVGPATEWPAGEEREVSRGEIISPQTSWKEAEQLSQEYIEKFVMRRYRPSRSADIQQEAFGLIYVFLMPDNPFGSAGYSVIIASVVMLVVTPLTKPMSPEFVANVFGDPAPAKEPTPTYASTALESPEPDGEATSS